MPRILDVPTLSIRTNVAGAGIFIDGAFAGISPLSGIPIAKGEHVVRCLYPDVSRWPLPVVIESLTISSTAPVERIMNFPLMYFITTDPYGAAVHVKDSIVGTTPLYYSSYSQGQVMTFSKDGYGEATVLSPAGGGVVYARLRSRDNESPLMVSSEQSKNLTPIVITSGATIVAGSVAAYFKIKADGRYNDYLSGGDPGALDRVRAFDRYSAIALVASQLSLIALSYILLSR